MIVVADAGPLIYLGAAGQLDLLQTLFERVVVPSSVWDEVVIAGVGKPGSAEVGSAGWLDVLTPSPGHRPVVLGSLDRGEADAILLCRELPAEASLCDDLAGRRAAQSLGLAVIGTLAVLLRAKEMGAVDDVGSLMEDLIDLGFRASPALLRTVLALAGEE